MKDKITTFERRIEMLFFITYLKKTPVPELVNMFSVCESTVYNDIVSQRSQ
jgi:DeoR/GlpR family transcriptional regulator of sugar metabolism